MNPAISNLIISLGGMQGELSAADDDIPALSSLRATSRGRRGAAGGCMQWRLALHMQY
jgi:hypothetical protein